MESIGRYRVVRELGRGAMGVVYLAEDPAIGRPVAIKTINLDNFSEPHEIQTLQDRLFREARSAGILSHPGIVTIYDVQHLGHTASIVMEFVEGVTIFEKMNQGALEPGDVLSMLEQTAAAMDYAHSKGVLHRDIKPAATPAPVVRKPAAKSPQTIPARKAVPAPIPRSRPSTTPSEPEVVPIEIRTDPPGAKVSAKGESCVTPCSLDLPSGAYYLTASLEGYKDTHRLIRVPDQLDISIQLDRPMGLVAVHGHAGSTIYLNGQAWKDKAPARLSLAAGSYTIYLESPDGLRTPTQTLEITENKIIDIH
jgi:hypothetical protein